MMEKDWIENEFRIRSYGKTELAMLYCPGVCPRAALRTFNLWLNKNPFLLENLSKTGLRPSDRIYTPLQVKMIVEALGTP